VADRGLPAPGRGGALVAVTAVPITPLDVLCATGTSYFGRPALPYVPGVQGVGVVAEGPWAGTRVWFPTSAGMLPGDGAMAEYCAVPAEDLVPLPEGVTDVQAAALGLSAVAAWMALTWRGGLRAGERVLVLGAGGVVGQVAVQAARLLGAARVAAACRSAEAADAARAAGADEVVALSDGDEAAELAGRLAAACGGAADLVVDPLFGVPASAAARALAPRGRLVNLGGSAGATAVLDSATLRGRSAAVLGYTNNELTREQRHAALTEVLEHAAAGRIRVAYDTAEPAGVADAWRRQASGTARRRVVVRF
jgi:NADPH:quinone reductase-like Zn-dependent oxidoreductase